MNTLDQLIKMHNDPVELTPDGFSQFRALCRSNPTALDMWEPAPTAEMIEGSLGTLVIRIPLVLKTS